MAHQYGARADVGTGCPEVSRRTDRARCDMQNETTVDGAASGDGGARAGHAPAAATNEVESRATAPRGDLARQIAALGLGAAAMYFLDPDRGRRRRHLVRDKLVHAAKQSGDAVGTTSQDLANRAGGLAAVARRRLNDEQPDDGVLADRVRAALGRAVSHPGAIGVVAQEGRIVLSGPVLADEADKLVANIRRVRGVAEVVDR